MIVQSYFVCLFFPPVDPRTYAPNGRACYYCDGQDCSNTVSCSGTEDRCITATLTNRGPPMLVKGCVSKYICGALKCSFIQDVSCCEGDLCNGDKRVTQGFRNNADESVNQSVTQSILQSFMHPGAKSVTKRFAYNDAKSVRQKVTYNDAKSVNQSFLFLCCSLLSYFLWL
uniref:Snake toxin/toxin-like domain-containing protein n=1 Tax=Sinocyclocheilus rhinocerous TaxID=307959 RepID=A0A673HFQ2_9TELE